MAKDEVVKKQELGVSDEREFDFGFRFSREYLEWTNEHKNVPDKATGAVQLDIIEAVANAER